MSRPLHLPFDYTTKLLLSDILALGLTSFNSAPHWNSSGYLTKAETWFREGVLPRNATTASFVICLDVK